MHSFKQYMESSKEKLANYANKAIKDKENAKYQKDRAQNSRAANIVRGNPEGAKKDVEAINKADDRLRRRERGAHLYTRKMMKKEESLDMSEEQQYDLIEQYLLENNIDIDTLTEEELNELIGKIIGGAAKLAGKGVVGAAKLAAKGIRRYGTTAGRADAAEKKADRAEKKNKDRERIRKAQARLQAARQAAASNP